MTTITKVTGYVTDDNMHWIRKEKDSVLADAREAVLSKYLKVDGLPYVPYYGWEGDQYRLKGKRNAFKKGFEKGYREAYAQGIRQARHKFMKHFDDIMPRLATLDAQAKDIG